MLILARRTIDGLALMAAVILVAVAAYTSADALARKIAGTGLPGSVDVVGYGLGLVIALGLPYCTLNLGHVSVSVFVRKVPGKFGWLLRKFAPLASTLFFIVLTWQIGRIALKRLESGDQMWMLPVETWPIWIAVTGLLCVTAITQTTVLALPVSDQEEQQLARNEGEAV
ncbi:TRAP transporter small permease [Roseibium aggregatum]|uniref:TRAP transporter small permease protein n=1 Tax=Roseibium aggregatum TaxID=187304 RepID=A0A939EGW4_9HYPH|nr:TRAP transporter small permease [Roseibium aggregatum]MBN9672992.1 TRAP transporter small permease [Roseibium aggregatum]